MSLKLVLLSVDGTFVHNGKISEQIGSELARFARELGAIGVKTALWSNNLWTVGPHKEPIQQWFTKKVGSDVKAHGYRADGSPARRTANSALPILQQYGVDRHEAVLVGGMEEDMMAGVQNQLLLLRPDWYQQNMEYGFSVASVSDLARFCFVFALRQHPIFWQIKDGSLDISAGGPFSTMYQDYAVFGGDARSFAKQGLGHPEFWFYFTVSSLYFSGLLNGVSYICGYPGHSPASDPDKIGMATLLMKLGKCFRINLYHDLIVRHTLALKSQHIKAIDRTFLAQINTIRLQRRPRRNLSLEPNKSALTLQNKTVLVVDDFITSGRSLEAARILIEAAGGHARMYCWLKTISSSYQRIADPLDLNPYNAQSLKQEPKSVPYSYAGAIIAPKAPAEIQNMFDRYMGWNW